MNKEREKLCVVFDIDETLIQFINKKQKPNIECDNISKEDKSQF